MGFPRATYAAKSVGVLVVGDADAAGDLHHELTSTLEQNEFSIIALDDVEGLLESAAVDEEAERLLRVLRASLQRANELYHDGELVELRNQLESIEDQLNEFPAAGELARDYYVLRVATQLDVGKPQLAREPASRALIYDLDAKPDPRLFPPGVATLIQEERERLIPARLTITDVPDHAEIRVMGEVRTSPVRLAPGTHIIEVRAPFYQTRAKAVELLPAQELTLHLPLSFQVRDAVRDEIRRVVGGDKVGELLAEAPGDVLVIVSDDGAAIVAMANGDVARGPATTEWIADTARAAVRGTGPFLGGGALEPGWRWTIDVSTGWVIRRQSVKLNEEFRFGRFNSTGPTAEIRTRARSLLGPGRVLFDFEVQLRAASIGGAQITERFSGEQWLLTGGTSTTLRAAVGYEYLRVRSLGLRVAGLAAAESTASKSTPDSSLDVGITTPFTRLGIGVRTGVSLSVPGRAQFYLLGDFLLAGLGSENDDVRLGDELDLITEYRGLAGARWGFGAWGLSLETSASRLTLSFAGFGNNGLYPRPEDAVREIEDYVFSLRVDRTF